MESLLQEEAQSMHNQETQKSGGIGDSSVSDDCDHQQQQQQQKQQQQKQKQKQQQPQQQKQQKRPNENSNNNNNNDRQVVEQTKSHECKDEEEDHDEVIRLENNNNNNNNSNNGGGGGGGGPRERLKRHRREVAGQVWIPDMWGQEDFLKDWIDCSAFDASLMPQGLMLARASLMEEGRRSNSNTLSLRVERSSC